MKALLTSDTHGMLPENLPDSDIIIHAGDIGPDRDAAQWFATTFREWAEQAARPIYATWGNHDFIGEKGPVDVPENVQILVNDGVKIGNHLVWFTPWVTNLPQWAFNRDEVHLEEVYATIPDEATILVSHAPPNGILDYLPDWGRVGGVALRKFLSTHPGISLVICGHIHEGYGEATLFRDDLPSIKVYNVAHCDLSYDPVNPPVVVDFA